ncbi:MAG TPA: metallophosphoesterase [Actinomycetota bacterium]|nr:metallophosphoesterase [Actinomycetota bacterium]
MPALSSRTRSGDTSRRKGVSALAGAATLGLAPVAYGFVEAKRYRLSRYTLPVLPPGASPIRILQVSDFHLRLGNRRMIRFLESLTEDEYDLVFATGDLLGAQDAADECLRVLNGLQATTARMFVFGSSDYFAPVLKNYFDYFLKRRSHGSVRNPTEYFRSSLKSEGWRDLNNANLVLDVNATRTQVTGMDDPYLKRDDRTLLRRDPAAELAMVVVHDPAPYDEAFSAGYDLLIAGHTHGGQVRFPFVGALVTNSTLPTALARGASRVGDSWLFVTPGVGTGKYAPFRFLCPPEASAITLVARPA